ncbi:MULTISPECIES: ribonucleoside-diphosphate reductase subunit alpha [Microcystis]|jgi:ribonucleoside-diphosphate reductase alpha chain|uniref:Ribonucleoside-diphosphate reductase n=1 Tax=Microcystis viridis FACHB-1342 TaxID=2692900 RepID=A0ABR8G989_MICVR|nr:MULTISPECIES: ribonucleoside-diphosphate reductase subunit alpha [Microcystis]MBD2599716.1 ribonucleoside-diphosphate reductase subunit alpha [Microcystis viridis FACHB-1342]MCA2624767.1 ribonucleoside-diphosphate reductase subunit alpha [Microcystis sp. M19BS1]MCA2630848.1 ribonucleoside-diphosphate reductase subunit alpha [Microcystis sp. M20BS1]MDB9387079.1 ribonucleoside-diphosphate reductase subunit alpha [Microcystis aeruginosa CS-583]ROI08510.1 ribonucleoside-diphosphate reductase su
MQSKPLTTAVSIHKNNEVIPFRSTPLANMGSHGIRVIRRDGSTTSLNIGKIRDVVEWACEGKKVNSIALEAGLTTRLRDGITTREIQDNLINCALEMCSPEEPDWRYVAGRLHIWSLWKDTLVVRGYQYGNYEKTVKTQVKNRLYDERILIYSEAELKEAGSWINPDWDIDYDYAGALLITSRYLLKNELPQEALLTCSLLLATVEEPANRLPWAKKFYQAIAQRKISLATPILANLRTPKGSLTSCFILSIDDSLESIFSEITNAARISKNGGGVGVNVSRIRSTGSWVMGKANASGGIIPWIKLLNDTAIAVNQGGRRAGAVTIGVDIWHLDVPEFLEMQTENGDQRRKAYDVFPQLVITDEFMRRVITKAEWTLVDPYEVRTKLGIELAELWGEEFEEAYRLVEANLDKEVLLYKKINARDLFKSIMRSQVETGMPYIAFKDTINRANPNKHDGYIPGVNLCTESFSNVTPDKTAHCCNLVSLNLANIDKEEIESNCQIAVRILDNTIDITNPPFDNAKNHNDKYRTIGVGAMGLADWLAKRKLSYNNLSEISNLFEEIGYWCTYSSMELAKERGAYQAFLGSEWSQGKLIGAKPVEWFLNNAVQPQRWQQLATDIQRFGIRNSHITAIAPNTSSSLVQGCTASVLPVYSRFFYDKWAKGTVPIAPPFIEEAFWFYPENKNLEQQQVVKAIATMQEWIDTGISMELLFNLNEGVYFPAEPNRCLTAKDIFDTLIMAWELGCKAIYYVRTVQKDNFRESDDSCSSCAN